MEPRRCTGGQPLFGTRAKLTRECFFGVCEVVPNRLTIVALVCDVVLSTLELDLRQMAVATRAGGVLPVTGWRPETTTTTGMEEEGECLWERPRVVEAVAPGFARPRVPEDSAMTAEQNFQHLRRNSAVNVVRRSRSMLEIHDGFYYSFTHKIYRPICSNFIYFYSMICIFEILCI